MNEEWSSLVDKFILGADFNANIGWGSILTTTKERGLY